MAQDTTDATSVCKVENSKNQSTSLDILRSELHGKEIGKDRGKRMLRAFLNRLRLKKCASATISRPDPSYKVAYLGNVVTGWAKGDGCVEKPLTTLWRNYTHSSRPDVRMELTVSCGGLRATTKDHGLTEYWAHRLTTCAAPDQFPRLFCWVYRHEGKRLRHELRCHAVLCPSASIARQIEAQLKHSLQLALAEFKRDKISKQNARLSLVNSVYDNPTIPRRKILLSTGSHNYRPPLERSKSAPKLTSIEEIIEEEEDICEVTKVQSVYKKILRHYDSTSALLEKRKCYLSKLQQALSPSKKVSAMSYQICDKDEDFKQHDSNNQYNSKDREDFEFNEKQEMILNELVENSMRSDLVESCDRTWFSSLGETPDLIPLDSDEGSLSSGCESASTVTSDLEAPVFPTIEELAEEAQDLDTSEKLKTDIDFKVGGYVLSRVRNFEGNYTNADILKYCGLNSLYNSGKNIMGNEEVSLIPVGETPQADFSSLKVFKRRSISEPSRDTYLTEDEHDGVEEDNRSASSDESGYEDEDVASSVANVVLV